MAPHSSTLASKIPWTGEPGRLQSMGLLRVGHDWASSLSLSHFYLTQISTSRFLAFELLCVQWGCQQWCGYPGTVFLVSIVARLHDCTRLPLSTGLKPCPSPLGILWLHHLVRKGITQEKTESAFSYEGMAVRWWGGSGVILMQLHMPSLLVSGHYQLFCLIQAMWSSHALGLPVSQGL